MQNNIPTIELGALHKQLGESIDQRFAELDQLRDRLHLITLAALDRIDGDSASDTAWSEIVGLAKGDVHWLQHAKASYEHDHDRLVAISRKLVESLIDALPEEGPIDEKWKQHEAACVADQIEETILPQMFLAESGRTFIRSQGGVFDVEQA